MFANAYYKSEYKKVGELKHIGSRFQTLNKTYNYEIQIEVDHGNDQTEFKLLPRVEIISKKKKIRRCYVDQRAYI